VALQVDGKIVVIGDADRSAADSKDDMAILRYNTNGTLDTSWDGDGKLTRDWGESLVDRGNAIAIQSDGKILAGMEEGTAADEDFVILRYTGTPAAVPEMGVSGQGVSIADGDTSPQTADNTDFGSTGVSGGTVDKTFTIYNTAAATGPLTVTGITFTGAAAGDFSFSGITFPATIGIDSSTTFQVTFDPSAAGLREATLNIANNDSDENPYDFAIQGTGVEFDYGDAPDSNYLTLAASGGARHVIDADLFMGAAAPDVDTNGFGDGTEDNANTATDDDTEGSDDEDGAASFAALARGDWSYSVDVTVTNNTGSAGTLIGWIDFDRDGAFQSDEGTTVTVADSTSGGTATLEWTNIQGEGPNIVPGDTFARFRLTTDASITTGTPGGAAADGEVEDYALTIGAGNGTIWSEPFDYPDYTTVGPGTPAKWTRTATAGRVIGNRLTSAGNENWYSEVINISGLTDVSLRADLSTNNNWGLSAYYSLNGGSWTPFANDWSFPSSGGGTAAQTGLNGNTVKIRVVMGVNGGGNLDTVDNVMAFLPQTTISKSGDDLVIEDVRGADTDDALTISLSGANLVITEANSDILMAVEGISGATGHGTGSVSIPLSEFTGNVIVNGQGGDDRVTVDFSGGDIGRNVTVNGGGQTTRDALAVKGDGVDDTAVYTPDASTTGNGQIVVNGTRTITFTGLEPVDITGMATATLSPPGATDALTVAEGVDFVAGGANQAIRVSGTSGGTTIETVAFYNNTSVVINTTTSDATDDSITVNETNNAHGNTNLTITTHTGTGATSDTISVNGALSVPGNLTMTSGQITTSAGLTTSGGNVSLTATSGVTLSGADADVTTSGGTFTVDADSDDNGTGTYTQDNASSAVAVGAGNISITAGDLDLTGTLAGTGTLALIPSIADRPIQIGTEVSIDYDGNQRPVKITGLVISGYGTYDVTMYYGSSFNQIFGTGYPTPSIRDLDWNSVADANNAITAVRDALNADRATQVNATTIIVPRTLHGDGNTYYGSRIHAAAAAAFAGPSNQAQTFRTASWPDTAYATFDVGFNISDAEITNLQDGFSSITIGDAAAGTGAVDVDSSTFTDPLTIVGGSIAVTELNAGTNGVTLTARTGAITDGGDVGTDVTASSLVATAATGAGTGANALETAVSNLEAVGGTGGVNVANTGNLTIGGVGALTGVSATDSDVTITSSSSLTVGEAVASGSGNVALTTDTIAVNASVSGTGTLAIAPATASRTIGLGGGSGDFNISDAEISNLQDGFSSITIGDAASGTGEVQIDTATFTDPVTIAGGTIHDHGGTDVTAPTVTLDGNVSPGQSPGILSVAGDVDLANGDTFTVEIDGTAGAGAVGGHDQLSATGSVDIVGTVTLTLTGSPTLSGGETFTIISRTGGTGTFDGRPEGHTFSNFLGSGLNATLTYAGGTGDDVVITAARSTTTAART